MQYFLYAVWVLCLLINNSIAQQCSNGATVGEGNPENREDVIDSVSGVGTLLLSDDSAFTITCCGNLESWTINAGENGTIHLQIWRKNGSVWQLVGQNTFEVAISGKVTYTVPTGEQITVQKNDVLGWFSPGAEILTYDKKGGVVRTFFQSGVGGNTSVGGAYDWEAVTKETNRKYAMRVALAPGTAPTFDNLPAEVLVLETTPIGTSVYQITATDTDLGDNLTVAMITASSIFQFSPENNTVWTIDSLTEGSHSLQFEATDSCGNTHSDSLTIRVFEENYFEVSENETIGSPVGTVLVHGVTVGVDVTYSISGYLTGSPHFAINSSSGLLSTSAALDYETNSVYVIQVLAVTSSPVATSSVNVTVAIRDFNDHDPEFINSTLFGSLIENTAAGTSVFVISAFDPDIGLNASIIYTILENTSDANATTYVDLDATTGILSVKTPIDREIINSLRVEILATEDVTPARSATATVTITIEDINDYNPVLDSTFYNGAAPYSDTCNGQVTTISATDKDTGENALMSYYIVQSDDSYLFRMDESTGVLGTQGTLSKAQYTLSGKARDNGNPELHSTSGATIRIDTFTPSDVILSFYMDISKNKYLNNEEAFLTGLEEDVFSSHYSNPQVRRWCIQETSQSSIIVHVYVLASNTTDYIANMNVEKDFVNNTETHRFVAVDESGTLSAKITGSSWSVFKLVKVLIYTDPVTSSDTSTPWIETTEGIAVVSACAAFALLLTVIGAILIYRKCCRKTTFKPKVTDTKREKKKKQRPQTPEIVNAVPLKQSSPKVSPVFYMDVPPPYYKGNHRTTAPPPKYFDTPVTLQKASGGYKTSTKIGISRTDSDTSLPTVNESYSPEEGSYIFRNRKFDGHVYDQGSGQIQQYNTKSGERNWIRTPDGDPF